MENKRYFLLGILALGCVQSAFGMKSVGGGSNQPNNNQPFRLPLAYNAPQNFSKIQKETIATFTVHLVHGCMVKIVVSSVATSATLEDENEGTTQTLPLVVNKVVNQQLITPPGTNLNQANEAVVQFSNISGLPAGISVPQVALSLWQLINPNLSSQN